MKTTENVLRIALCGILRDGSMATPSRLVLWAAEVMQESEGETLELIEQEDRAWLSKLPEALQASLEVLESETASYLKSLAQFGGAIELVEEADIRADLVDQCVYVCDLRRALQIIGDKGPRLVPELSLGSRLDAMAPRLAALDELVFAHPAAWVHLRHSLEFGLLSESPWRSLVDKAKEAIEKASQIDIEALLPLVGQFHPTSDELADYAFGDLVFRHSERIRLHLSVCGECKSLVERIAPLADVQGEVAEQILADALKPEFSLAGWLRDQFGVGDLLDCVRNLLPAMAAAAAPDEDSGDNPPFFSLDDAPGRVELGRLVFGMKEDYNRIFLLVEPVDDQTELVEVRCFLASPQDGKSDALPLRGKQRGPQWHLRLSSTDLGRVRRGEVDLIVVGTAKVAEGSQSHVAVVYSGCASKE